MKLSSMGSVAFAALMFSGCASLPPGWAEYKAATKCHLQNKNDECDKSYQKAIKKNPKLPGLQASYASHLYRRGDAASAEEHFRAEIENHPHSQKAIGVVLNPDKNAGGQPAGTTSTPASP